MSHSFNQNCQIVQDVDWVSQLVLKPSLLLRDMAALCLLLSGLYGMVIFGWAAVG